MNSCETTLKQRECCVKREKYLRAGNLTQLIVEKLVHDVVELWRGLVKENARVNEHSSFKTMAMQENKK